MTTKATIVNRVPVARLAAATPPPAPLAEFVGSCIGMASGLIGVDLGLTHITLRTNRLSPTWTCDDRSATLFLVPGATAWQQFYQASRCAFMAVSTNALGGMDLIPALAHPGGRFGLWPHEMLAALFQVESVTTVWGAEFESYQAATDAYKRQSSDFPGGLYRLGLDLLRVVGRDDLYRWGHPRYVVDRWRVEVEPWLATLTAPVAREVMRVMEGYARRPFAAAPATSA